ncbi:MAG: tRNA pseudouridine(38-40) synthase TruA [Bacteriovoracaceae bacterium]|jgi:tRNA pseudouridine38-40 synthase|nr:tRNA pseudouridine(38-40) synthase TruA [Bacteriovoracaceae bacterium]
MHHYLITLSYNGTQFSGWQSQTGDLKTIQSELLRAFRKSVKQRDVVVVGASRTDRGVHALDQKVKVSLLCDLQPDALQSSVNYRLHPDVKILNCTKVSKEFNLFNSCQKKTYHYYFSNQKNEIPIHTDQVVYVSREMDIEKMKKACSTFVGEHDFRNFYSKSSQVKSTVREITHFELSKCQFSPFLDEVMVFKVEGYGFLKHLIRYMVGTIFQVGLGYKSEDHIREYLEVEKDDKLSKKAPAHGLYLYQIELKNHH